MRYGIDFAEAAHDDMDGCWSYDRIAILDGMEQYLRHGPTRESRSRIKALRGLSHPQYRLRLGDVRVFYDVHGTTVEIVAVVNKSQADEWLRREGVRTESED
jgi:mRNA interferase RelE/StbE